MPSLVPALSTKCMCMFGKAQLPIFGSQIAVKLGVAKPLLTIMDVPKGTFGMCNSGANPATKNPTGSAPCTPTLLPPMWLPGAPKVLIGGKPALTDASMMTCALGGPNCIMIMPGPPSKAQTS